jgi:NAD dependent epimerase/dehydratase family enzyme
VNILIAGSSGLLGSSLYESFSRRGFNVKRINRSNNGDIFFKDELFSLPEQLQKEFEKQILKIKERLGEKGY